MCVLFDIYGEDNSFHAYISFFIVDLPTGKSRKISDAAYLLAVSVSFVVCIGTSMSQIKHINGSISIYCTQLTK